MPESKILFINKGAESKSLSRSSGAEKRRIFSHVQRSSYEQLPHLPKSVPDSGGTLWNARVLCSSGAIESGKQGVSLKRTNERLTKPTRDKQHRTKSKEIRPSSPLDGLVKGTVKFDPFDSSVVPVTPYMTLLLDFYRSSLLDRVFPSKALADESRKHTLSFTIQDPIALNAILATTSGALFAFSGENRHGYSTMHFKGQALRYLKSELGKAGDAFVPVSTLYAISMLVWVECLQGDFEAAQAHIQGLDHLYSRTSGIRESPLPIMMSILACSYYCSAMLRAPPRLEPVVLCRDRISTSTTQALYAKGGSKSSSMASRFFMAPNKSLLGQELLNYVSNEQRCLEFKELTDSGDLSPTYEDVQFIFTTQAVGKYQLLNMPFDAHKAALSPAQDAVRLALYLFSQPIVSIGLFSSAFSGSMAQQLKAALEATDLLTSWHCNCDLLLWVLLITAQVSYGGKEWPWVVAHSATAVRILKLESLEQMEDLLIGFFYLPNIHKITMERLWRDIEIVLGNSEK